MMMMMMMIMMMKVTASAAERERRGQIGGWGAGAGGQRRPRSATAPPDEAETSATAAVDCSSGKGQLREGCCGEGDVRRRRRTGSRGRRRRGEGHAGTRLRGGALSARRRMRLGHVQCSRIHVSLCGGTLRRDLRVRSVVARFKASSERPTQLNWTQLNQLSALITPSTQLNSTHMNWFRNCVEFLNWLQLFEVRCSQLSWVWFSLVQLGALITACA